MQPIEFVIPLRTPLLNVWQRMHWAQRRLTGQQIAWAIRAQVGPGPRVPIERCTVTVERQSTRAPDADGLYGGLKPLLDALQPCSKRHPYGLGLILDDGPRCLLVLHAWHVQGPLVQTRVVIAPVDG